MLYNQVGRLSRSLRGHYDHRLSTADSCNERRPLKDDIIAVHVELFNSPDMMPTQPDIIMESTNEIMLVTCFCGSFVCWQHLCWLPAGLIKRTAIELCTAGTSGPTFETMLSRGVSLFVANCIVVQLSCSILGPDLVEFETSWSARIMAPIG